ncbi:hypothetical protein PARC_b0381 [Pseudoalteromonas arctica A 37-1-2]|uniref:Uncharacterized protein n=1 Tax=Pseudoalteromonas arctica A 37-1-2 TaxID=1117313 RepID=A0A290SDA8_9GAMM|nr:hypothetical protein PARC_b0381 [Pseudoalteromonas arctica A 37-1-2]
MKLAHCDKTVSDNSDGLCDETNRYKEYFRPSRAIFSKMFSLNTYL